MKKRSKSIKKYVETFFEEEKKIKENQKKEESEEISLKTLIIVFVIGLVIIGGLFLYTKSNEIPQPDDKIVKVFNPDSLVDITEDTVNKAPPDESSNTLIINDFEDDINTSTNRKRILRYEALSGPGANMEIEIVLDPNDESNHALKLNYTPACEDWCDANSGFIRKIVINDWKDYRFVNFMIYPLSGKKGALEFNIIDNDDNRWMYYNDKILLETGGWQKIKIPVNFFTRNEWTDKKQIKKEDFNDVKAFQIALSQLNPQEVLIDNIYLSKE
ncbi:MAG: CIA30 family protein [Nanoarchaeota archaeon]|nr:CIA30 family protein [Nanoarchaeota archaeon]MBU1855195.1 CIA30 family protein [Nanoarchaeota archaeon]